MPSLRNRLLGLMMRSSVLRRMAFNWMRDHALDFLHEREVAKKQQKLLEEKLRKMRNTGIGKELGLDKITDFKELPLTTYAFYERHFLNPTPEAFMYPLDQYVETITSGTTGKPKKYLIPMAFYNDFLEKTGISAVFLLTHDEKRVNLSMGDTFYVNIPPAPYASGMAIEFLRKRMPAFEIIKIVPEDASASYHEKVDYFVKNYENIDVAFMTVTSLLDDVYSKIGKPFKLKGFFTQDRSAESLKEEIRKITGCYPASIYGATEFVASTVPSIEYPTGFIFDWRVVYCEFLPEREAITPKEPIIEGSQAISVNELEKGERYQLVVTPFKNDLVRYLMPDILECVDMGDDILDTPLPVFKFHKRADELITLHNFTRIDEEELLAVLRDSGIECVDFTAREEIHGAKEYLAIYIELIKPTDIKEAKRRIHQRLLEVDKDYRDLVDFLNYDPLKLVALRKGAFKNFLRYEKGTVKIPRVNMKEGKFRRLMNFIM